MDIKGLILGIILPIIAIIIINLLKIFLPALLHEIDKQQSPTKENDNNMANTKSQRPTDKDYSEIEAEIMEITGWIGVSEPVNTTSLFEKILDGKEKEVIDIIANHLSLPMKITTKYCSEEKYKKDGSSPLAEVSVGNIPHYGSSALKNYPCVITLYPGYNSRPDRFIYIISHKLCRNFLRSK